MSFAQLKLIDFIKKEIVKLKDKLIEFGINVYGKGVEFANYDFIINLL